MLAPLQHLQRLVTAVRQGPGLFHDSNGFVNRLVGGWEFSGIWSLQSGFALPWNTSAGAAGLIYYGDPANIQLPSDQRRLQMALRFVF
jgi:hypothetical protein